MAITKHLFTCVKGDNLGQVLELNLNDTPAKALGGIFCIKKGKLVFKEQEDDKHAKIKREYLNINKPNTEKILERINDDLGTSSGSVYILLRSDLYALELDGYKTFSGTKELCPAAPDKDTINIIKKHLAPAQAAIMHKISGTIEKYIEEYIKDPLAVIEKQNKHLESTWSEIPVHTINISNKADFDIEDTVIGEVRPETEIFESMIKLNALVEKELVNRTKKDTQTVIELKNTDYLAEGDYSPPHGVKPGERIHENGRGNLEIRKTGDADLMSLLAESKIDATRPGTSKLSAAMRAYKRIIEQFEDKYHRIGRSDMTMPICNYLKNGGSCIDQAIILQLALQEAGVKSRLVRGRYLNSTGRHAWVEADVLEPGKYALILDPAQKTIAAKFDNFMKHVYRYETGKGEQLDCFNVIWRTK